MKRIYACLLGNWIDITDCGTVHNNCDPVTYFAENLKFEANSQVAKAFEFGYLNVQYEGKNYRIDPSCIQILTE